MVEHEMVELDGARVRASRQGAGLPLVLVHGGPGLWEDFGALAEMVEDLVEVHRYDQRGGGESDRIGPYDIATAVADLDALREHWGHDRWVVGGHSFGAALALAYALEHPERLMALVLISGTGVDLEWKDEYHAETASRRSPDDREQLADLHIQRAAGVWGEESDRQFAMLSWATDFASRRHDKERAADLWRAPGPNYEQNAAMNADWERLLDEGLAERVSAIEVPVLLLQGADDPRPISAAERLAERLPSARVEVLPECGHYPWLEQPDATQRVLRDFLSGVARLAEAGD